MGGTAVLPRKRTAGTCMCLLLAARLSHSLGLLHGARMALQRPMPSRRPRAPAAPGIPPPPPRVTTAASTSGAPDTLEGSALTMRCASAHLLVEASLSAPSGKPDLPVALLSAKKVVGHWWARVG